MKANLVAAIFTLIIAIIDVYYNLYVLAIIMLILSLINISIWRFDNKMKKIYGGKYE